MASSESKGLKAQMQAVKKAEHNFACLMTKEGVILELDKRKGPAILKKRAREAGGGQKGALGVAHFEGSLLVLKCEDEPPGPLSKLLRKHLHANGVKAQVAIEVNGERQVDDDGEGGRAALLEGFAAVKPDLSAVLQVAADEKKKVLQTLIKGFEKSMKSSDDERADLILTKLNEQVTEIKTRRAEGKRRRLAEVTALKDQAADAMARIARIRDARRAS